MVGLISALVAHFIGDFLLQSRDVALNKAKHLGAMSLHLLYVGMTLFIVAVWFKPMQGAVIFTLINVFAHGIIDGSIWNAYKRYSPNVLKFYEDKWFYTTIGFDQLLHTSILFLTWMYV